MKHLHVYRIEHTYKEQKRNVLISAYSKEEATDILEHYYLWQYLAMPLVTNIIEIKKSTKEGQSLKTYYTEEFYNRQLAYVNKMYKPDLYE